MEENAELVAHARLAVLQVAVVEAEAGIDPDARDAGARRGFDLPGEIIVEQVDGIAGEIEVGDLAHVGALDEAEDDAGVVVRDLVEDFRCVDGAGEIKNAGAGAQGLRGDIDVIGLDRNTKAGLGEFVNDGDELFLLCGRIDPRGLHQGRLRPEVDDGRALFLQDAGTAHRGLGREGDALAVPRVGREIDHAHHIGTFARLEPVRPEGEIGHRERGLPAVFLVQRRERGEVEHGLNLGRPASQGEGFGSRANPC